MSSAALSVLLILLVASGCAGGAQLAVRRPVESSVHEQCTGAGLRSCERIAQGTTLYADGKQAEGEPMLDAGLRANAGKVNELAKFADGLASLGNVPQPAIQLAYGIAVEAAQQQAQARVTASPPRPAALEPLLVAVTPSAGAPPIPADPAGLSSAAPIAPATKAAPTQTSFWQFSGSSQVTECRFPGTPRMMCVQEVTQARKIVTDVMVSTGCPADILIAGRHRLEFDWLVYAPAGRGAEVHGASLPLDEMHSITVAMNPKNSEAMTDVRCGVTTAWHYDLNPSSRLTGISAPPKTSDATTYSADGI